MKTKEEIISEILENSNGAWIDIAEESFDAGVAYASHPSPMSAEPTVQQLRDAAKNNPDTFLAGALYVIDNYKLNSHPMSAEQVCRWVKASERLPDIGITVLVKYFDTYQELYYKNNIWFVKGTNLVAYSECFSLQLEWLETFATTPSVKADGWVSVEEKPLITKDENNNWTCTEDGDKEFIAALPYTEKMKDGTYKDKWWIHHCIIEDEVGLYIVDDEGNTPAGWSIEDVTHWQPLPNPPKQQ